MSRLTLSVTHGDSGREDAADSWPQTEGAALADGLPRVSIGLPVYNGERHLPAALDSLLAQTYRDFELIISDNALTDRTEEICRGYAARDSRIRYHRSPVNRGMIWNHDRVFHLARGEYFKWVGHDDLYDPDMLRHCVEALDRDPGAVLAMVGKVDIDAEGRVFRKPLYLLDTAAQGRATASARSWSAMADATSTASCGPASCAGRS
jgi:glycosyltransferase involved in cell wall biosynthesis